MDDKVISITRQKKTEEEFSPEEKFDLSVAKQIILSDPAMLLLLKKLGVTTDEGARWILFLSQYQLEIARISDVFCEKFEYNPAFVGLLSQALASASAEQLTSIGINGMVTHSIFKRFQKNSIAHLVNAQHIDDLEPVSSDNTREF